VFITAERYRMEFVQPADQWNPQSAGGHIEPPPWQHHARRQLTEKERSDGIVVACQLCGYTARSSRERPRLTREEAWEMHRQEVNEEREIWRIAQGISLKIREAEERSADAAPVRSVWKQLQSAERTSMRGREASQWITAGLRGIMRQGLALVIRGCCEGSIRVPDEDLGAMSALVGLDSRLPRLSEAEVRAPDAVQAAADVGARFEPAASLPASPAALDGAQDGAVDDGAQMECSDAAALPSPIGDAALPAAALRLVSAAPPSPLRTLL